MKTLFCLKGLALLVAVAAFIAACSRGEITNTEQSALYGKSKIWAHQVDDTLAARVKSQNFEGLEVDLTYSKYQDKLFVGHEIVDSNRCLTFQRWVKAIPYPDSCRYWLDIKNLSVENADSVCKIILEALPNARNQVFVENMSEHALLKVKAHGLPVLLWINNPHWDGQTIEQWKEANKKKIELLKPNALSSWYQIFPLLSDTYPDMNIHYWHTPAEFSRKNVRFTKKVCRAKNVRVVLVDYDDPLY